MLGQYLSDHRTQIRDREARREDFRIRNFEIQRDSLLKLQEVIVDLTRNIGGIVTRARLSDALGVNDFPGYNDAVQWHAVRDRMQKIAVKVAEGRVLAEEAVSSDELPAKRKQELQAQLRKLAADFGDLSEQIKPAVQEWGELASLHNRIRILSVRTGDKEVIDRSEDLLKATNNWTNSRNAKEGEERRKVVDKVAESTLNSIGLALRNGPLS